MSALDRHHEGGREKKQGSKTSTQKIQTNQIEGVGVGGRACVVKGQFLIYV